MKAKWECKSKQSGKNFKVVKSKNNRHMSKLDCINVVRK